ncbi:HAD family phosphatase [Carboxydochorda subterranea]|uniref:HAD family phosphatase n=1 Tax=Carboxydichorda subterranea TaxID=3109565 RepID=A0ABZ1BZ18_9FIRM|nr:HAD family phosphatase [Limnochorda sp. L945t]WRP17939.1 HAD family phosphatase [Limnochorda sp. L945t]
MAAVIFDMDGVLVVSNPAHFRAWQEFSKESGVVITEEMFHREFTGRKNEEALEALFPGRFTPEEKASLSRRKEALFRERFVATLEPVPGVQALVRDLRRHRVPLALATSGPPENAAAIVRHLGIDGAFDAVITGQDVEAAKPDPAIFLKAARALGVAPAQAVIVEDSIAGVRAAVAAGGVCLAVTTTEPAERLREAGARRVVPDFLGLRAADLLEMLG